MASHARESPPNFQSIQGLADYPLTGRLILGCTNRARKRQNPPWQGKEWAGVGQLLEHSPGPGEEPKPELCSPRDQEEKNNFVLGKAGLMISVCGSFSPLSSRTPPSHGSSPSSVSHFGQLCPNSSQWRIFGAL